MDSIELRVTTGSDPVVVDLTADVRRFVAGRGDGIVSVFVPHATAGVAIMEMGAESDQDLLNVLNVLLPPAAGGWRHAHGSPGHGRDHVLPAFISPSVTVPVLGGRLELGRWQSIVLVDTNRDNQDRRVRVSFLAG